MDIKLFDSELKVMCVLWNEGDTTAKSHIRRSEKRNWLEHEYYLHTDKNGVSKNGAD
mgnify:CR=1 FL=1